jgi:hypothetical protein
MEILSLCFSSGEHSEKAGKINEWSRRFGLGKILPDGERGRLGG